MKHLSLALLVLFLGASAYAQSKLSPKDIESINQLEKSFEVAWLKNDEKGVLDLFWEDAALYPNGNAPIKGVDAIRKFWFTPSGTVHTLSKYEIKIDELNGEKSMAVSVGTNDIAWTAEKKGDAVIRRFTAMRSLMTVYLKRNDRWKIFKRHWSGRMQEVK